MAQAQALLVGIKSVSTRIYGEPFSAGCEHNEDNVDRLAAALGGFQVTTKKTQQATADNVLAALRGAAASLVGGDIFVFYIAGHDFGDGISGARHTILMYDRHLETAEFGSIWN